MKFRESLYPASSSGHDNLEFIEGTVFQERITLWPCYFLDFRGSGYSDQEQAVYYILMLRQENPAV
jgi:hypothetical protein